MLFAFTTLTINAETVVEKTTKSIPNTIDSAKLAIVNGVNFVDTSSTFKTVYQDVKSGIMGLAQGLKVGAEHVYKVLVIQQIMNAVVFLLLLIGSIILTVLCYKEWSKIEMIYKSYSSEPKEMQPVIFTTIYGIAAGIMFLTGILNLDVIVSGLGNPEYGAIMEIINFVKK